MHVHMCVCAYACMCVCVCACVYVCLLQINDSKLNILSMSLSAGHPTTRASTPHQCFDRHFQLTCHHEYETTVPHVWFMDGILVEHDGREFAINHGDGSLTLMDVSQSRYAERETLFQCCVNLTSGPQVCGEHLIFDPLGESCMLLGMLVTTEAHCYSV